MSQKLYVIVAELPNGNRLVTENKPRPLSQALEVALTFNQTMFSTAPAGEDSDADTETALIDPGDPEPVPA